MTPVHVREARSEILIFLDRHMPDNLSALKLALRILTEEVKREESNPTRNAGWTSHDTVK